MKFECECEWTEKEKEEIDLEMLLHISEYLKEDYKAKTKEDGGKSKEDGGKSKEDRDKNKEDGGKSKENSGKSKEDGGKSEEYGGKSKEDGGIMKEEDKVNQMLLVRAGKETNPGPEKQCNVADWELEEVPDTTEEYQNDRTICAVCGSGSVTPVVRT